MLMELEQRKTLYAGKEGGGGGAGQVYSVMRTLNFVIERTPAYGG